MAGGLSPEEEIKTTKTQVGIFSGEKWWVLIKTVQRRAAPPPQGIVWLSQKASHLAVSEEGLRVCFQVTEEGGGRRRHTVQPGVGSIYLPTSPPLPPAQVQGARRRAVRS